MQEQLNAESDHNSGKYPHGIELSGCMSLAGIIDNLTSPFLPM